MAKIHMSSFLTDGDAREAANPLKGGNVDDVEEDCSEKLLGKPTRFYYEDLKAITGNFSEVLGEGGFGKVFEGILLDGIKMAVTQLDGSSPVRKSFLTWVEANGSIHHVNLKKKIIPDIAKGLAYLHEECRRKIIRLNTKPQSILLDDNFNAKIPGSGLSKLVDKDQSKIVTIMRGPPGYLAPEWLSSVIKEKAGIL
ncbi:G-type lectin S-receptor serine/threonine-protein kinase [Salix suchowensis]|nr:G-type lectin S-receptor serine/threonine-protein kinase [Salix suchowensis]